MDKLFLTVMNMSLTGAFVIAAICLARLPLKKAPKIISYCLWAVAGFRLAVPFSIESVFSLIPFQSQPIPPDIAMQAVPRIESGIAFVNNAVSASLPAAAPGASVNPLQVWVAVWAWIWLFGAVVMALYGVISYMMLKRRLKKAAHIDGNLYEATIKSPFVLGIFHPKIYLPADLPENERAYVLLHERTHIRRQDHIIKFAAYFILCAHWFNPFAWAAFVLMGADMEMSCDEYVLNAMGSETKKTYSLSLLSLAAERRLLVAGSPLAFGEGGVKQRIKNVLKFKKPSRVIVILAVILAVGLSVGFAVNRVAAGKPLAEMQMVYVENPARSFRDMRLIWDGVTYYETEEMPQMPQPERGAALGYANDDYSTWHIYELKEYGRDYVLAVESDDVFRVMSSHTPEAPWRQYILENPTEKERMERLLSVTLYTGGSAKLATPMISSYLLTDPYYYSFEADELLIYYGDKENKEMIAAFTVLNDQTIAFKEAFVPLFADRGARYALAPRTVNEWPDYDALHTPYVGDNAAVGKIVNALPILDGAHKQQFFSIGDDDGKGYAPYTLTVYYELTDASAEDVRDITNAPKNAALLFALIDNLQEVKFAFRDTPGDGELDKAAYKSAISFDKDQSTEYLQSQGLDWPDFENDWGAALRTLFDQPPVISGGEVMNGLPDDTGATKAMTMDDVRAIAEEIGPDLTMDDLRDFTGMEIGSGLYIMRYEIKDTDFVLIVGSMDAKNVVYTSLARDGDNTYADAIDIRYYDIDRFINGGEKELVRPMLRPILGEETIQEPVSFQTDAPEFNLLHDRITATLMNNALDEEDVICGESYLIEKQVGGAWVEIPFKEGYGFHAIAHKLPVGASRTYIVDLEMLSEPLMAGKYRMSTSVYYGANTPMDALILYAEFSVTM